MKISIITLFPNMLKGFFEESIIKKAQEKGLVEVEIVNLRDFAVDSYGTVDDRPYGGGAGMVLRIEPLYAALQQIKKEELRIKNDSNKAMKQSRTILTSAKGSVYSQQKALEFSQLDHLVILAGHYEGFDERVMDYVDEEISLGDFVLTGGEIVAATIADSVARLIPGVLKKEDATQMESFFEVDIDAVIAACPGEENIKLMKEKGIKKLQLLEYPHYTRPEEFMGKKVPVALMSGHHKDIETWKIQKAYEQTKQKRPDLLDKSTS